MSFIFQLVSYTFMAPLCYSFTMLAFRPEVLFTIIMLVYHLAFSDIHIHFQGCTLSLLRAAINTSAVTSPPRRADRPMAIHTSILSLHCCNPVVCGSLGVGCITTVMLPFHLSAQKTGESSASVSFRGRGARALSATSDFAGTCEMWANELRRSPPLLRSL